MIATSPAIRALAPLSLAALVTVALPAADPLPATVALPADSPQEPEQVSFTRDIRPLLSDRCFLCHGRDSSTRKADLRLDSFEFATADLDGYSAIVPGNLDESELWYRITAEDPDDLMPPAKSKKKPFTAEEKDLIRRWIEQGAVYEQHWAFVAPQRPAVPESLDDPWAKNEIDAFVLRRLQEAGLEPSAEADPTTLIRRLFMDLTGLPPTPEEVDAFLADQRPHAYELWVDKLLSEEPYLSRHAERLATPWLDAARYADTNGIHMDAGRQMWAWRDQLLRSLRDNQPFDQFVIEQLAGDLLPDATVEQKVASGFHRNHVITDEGGAISEEYLVEYAADRVATTGSVFLGLSLNCARCHDHKFDPISQQDYYSMMAFFNSNQEPGLYTQQQNPNRAFEPFMAVPSPEQAEAKKALTIELEKVRAEMAEPSGEDARAYADFLATAQQVYGVAWAPTQVVQATANAGSTMEILADASVRASGANPDKEDHQIVLRTEQTGMRLLLLEALRDEAHFAGRVGRASNGNAVLSLIEAEAVSVADPQQRQPLQFTWAWADVEQTDSDFDVVNALDPALNRVWAVNAHNVDGGRTALFLTDQPFGYEGGTEIHVKLHYQSQYAKHAFGRVRLTPGKIGAAGIAQLPVADSRWYGTWPYTPTDGAGYDQVFGPEADPTIDFAKKYAPDDYSWVFVPQVKDAEVNTVLPAGQKVSFVGRRLFVPSDRELEVSLGSDDGIQVFLDGKMVFENRVNRGAAPDQDRVKLALAAGLHTVVLKIVNTGGPGGLYWKPLPPDQELGDSLVWSLVPSEARDHGVKGLSAQLSETWRTRHSPAFRAKLAKAGELEKELAALEASIPLTMVMKELDQPRQTYVLMRGAYDHPDKNRPVERSVPAALGALPDGAPKNRLGLALWLTGADNPLLARVTINRYWEMLFGTGIVETSEDFGLQGAWPSHPDLLDWLAVEFRESGWDTRAMIRKMVSSASYRQSARRRPEAVAVDPQNRLLASYPRRRLGAEEIRDQALYVSGLLIESFGGPSVKPYQPEGLWKEVAMLQSNTRNFVRGNGQDLWRRSMYTYWKRAVPPPSLLTFDAPTREFCTIRRGTTNTPLQALVLWNDEQFVEAARVLAQRTLEEAVPFPMNSELVDDPVEWRLARMFRRCTGRMPEVAELVRLGETLAAFEERYQQAPDDAEKLLSLGDSPLSTEIPHPELAAWTLLANAMLSLDETISHR